MSGAYRPFSNFDPPALAEIWCSQPTRRDLVQPLTSAVLERDVLDKPYFDRQGLIVAEADGRAAGFVHAAFGPADDQGSLCTRQGIVCLLMVRPELWNTEVPSELLQRAEDYLRQRGAETIWAGGSRRGTPFYLGLMGGSELRGVLDSDEPWRQLCETSGYEAHSRFQVFQRDLTTFRAPVSRRQLQVRRTSCVRAVCDPSESDWWEACTLGGFHRLCFELAPQEGGDPRASVTFWGLESFSTMWGVQSAGMAGLEVNAEARRQGLATCLVSDAFRQLQAEGYGLVEAQTPLEDTAAVQLFRGLGFAELVQGTEYMKCVRQGVQPASAGPAPAEVRVSAAWPA